MPDPIAWTDKDTAAVVFVLFVAALVLAYWLRGLGRR
jgi:hypothetical protein